MFPLHSETIALLCLAGLAAGVAAVIAVRGPVRLAPAAVILSLGLAWPWPIVFASGPDSYLLTMTMYLSLWTVGAIFIGLVWGVVARRSFRGRARLAAVGLPVLALFPSLLEYQRVPAAPCAERAQFALGDVSLAVPREIGVRSAQAEDVPRQAWAGEYSAWPGAKPAARALCRAPEGGREPLVLSHLSIPAGWFHRRLTAECATGTAWARREEICTAVDRTALTIVQIHARPDGLPGPTLGLFDRDWIVESIKAGERRGRHCQNEVNGPRSRYCSIWQVQPSGVLILMAARLGPPLEDEDTGRDARLLLEAFLSDLGPSGA